MAGLELHARDLAKFGQLVLDSGIWEGERLVSEAYIEEMLAQMRSARGCSGPNRDYVLRLAESLRAIDAPDPHVEHLASHLLDN